MTIRLGAVGYLNSRPLVYSLDRSPRFSLRFDLPSRCAALLHEGAIDVGLIPSIEYLAGDYRIAPDLALASRGPVASVAVYTTRPIADVGSIAMDTSSRTSVALTRVLCEKVFHARLSRIESLGPDLEMMLGHCDAALIIGDNALTIDHARLRIGADRRPVEKIDLGEAWTSATGLPFVYAFWAGRPGALAPDDVAALQAARDAGVKRPGELAREYFADAPEHAPLGERYLRDNIKYYLGGEERAALERFYRYAAEIGAAPPVRPLRFYP
jgi:chorismate dehydratase